MPCPSLWRQKCSPRVSTVPGGGFDLASDPWAPTPPRGYTDESPRGSTAESDSRWQFPIPVAFPIPRALSTLQRGRWNVPTHHHATVGRHGQHPPAPLSHRVGTVRDLDGSDRPCQPGQPARGPFHPVDHQRLRTVLGTKRTSRIPLTEGTSSPLPNRDESIAGRQWIFYAAENIFLRTRGEVNIDDVPLRQFRGRPVGLRHPLHSCRSARRCNRCPEHADLQHGLLRL